MQPQYSNNYSRQKQNGAVLAISLIILLILTIVVLSSNQSTLVQEKMSAAVREGHVTLSLVESGIVAAEDYLEGLTPANFAANFNATGNNGLYSEGNGPDDIYADAVWDAANRITVAVALPNNTAVDVDVKYFIQSLGLQDSGMLADNINVTNYEDNPEVEGGNLFRIVARSTGTNGNSDRVIVTYFGKNF